MNKTYLIFSHEFRSTVKRIGFLVMTLSVPVLAIVGLGLAHLVAKTADPGAIETIAMGYVDEVGGFSAPPPGDIVKFVRFDTRDEATQALLGNEISEYFVISSQYGVSGIIERFTQQKQLETPRFTQIVIKSFVTRNLLEGKIPPEIIQAVQSPLTYLTTRVTSTGEMASEESSIGNIALASVFALLLGLSLMFSSNYLLQGMGEEKESRLIEVLLSSVSVRQLLTGKVMGLGLAGISQVLLWLATGPVILSLAPASLDAFISSIHISTDFFVLAIVYFVLGYLLFAVLSIGVGAISPNAREGQQLALIYTMFCFVPLWFMSLLLFFPGSPIWSALTLFPITAPVQTMLRMGVVDIPNWEIVTSVALLALSIVVGMIAAIKIFRVHLLTHGDRPSLGDIIRNLKTG